MDLLNPSPVLALPVTMWAAARVFGEAKGMTKADALRRLSPLGLRDAPDGRVVSADNDPPPTNGALQAVAALEELGLLRKDELSASDPLLRWAGSVPQSYDEFCDQMRDAVMARGHTEDLRDTRTPGGARDLLRGLAWLLTKDPTKDAFSATSVERDRNASGNADDRVFVNPTRWNGFRYWAQALGFATPIFVPSDESNALVGDASRAVGATLRRWFAPGKEHPARTVVNELQEKLPVLLNGHVATTLKFAPLEADRVDPVTSFALLALEQGEHITLRMLSDATESVQLARLDPNEPARLVTHIVIREK